ncbi:MAG TPA: HEAT repeat domain-containing protein [Longimicrobiales bacterium]
MNRMAIARPSILITILAAARLCAGAELEAARPPAWALQDPADSLYRAAREALSRDEYRRAAELFHEIPIRYPSSTYAGDALYWEAFARYRLGTEDDLRLAMQALQRQAAGYPRAATRGDAQTLMVRINGALAQRGDAAAAEAVARKAAEEMAERQREIQQRVAEAIREAQEAAREAQREAEEAAREAQREALASTMIRGRRGETRDPSCSEDPQREVRIVALNALAQLDAESALPILKQVLERKDPCSADLRRNALLVLSRTESPEAEAILVKAARDDPDPSVRERAVRSLANVETETAVAALGEILWSSTELEVQRAALSALHRQESEQAGRILREFAQRDDIQPELREDAIRSIGRRGTVEDAEFLRQLFHSSGPEAKVWIVSALGDMEIEGNERWLLDIARNGAEPLEVRARAVYEAGTNGAPIEELVALYDAMPEKELRSRLISVYARRREAAAVDKLIDIARRETDIELRTRAITALARSGDPRVAQVLQEIIGT